MLWRLGAWRTRVLILVLVLGSGSRSLILVDFSVALVQGLALVLFWVSFSFLVWLIGDEGQQGWSFLYERVVLCVRVYPVCMCVCVCVDRKLMIVVGR